MRLATSTALRAMAIAAIVSALAAAPCASLAAELNLRIPGRAGKGPIPAKSPKGQSDTIGIVGEGVGETEFRAVDEIAAAVTSGQEGGPNGEIALRVLALPGTGGLQNIRDVLSRADIDFGIAPALVLDKAAASPAMSNLRQRIAYLAPLYIEEVHLLVGAGIRSISDLEGRTVSMGDENGSTQIVVQALLDALNLRVVVTNLNTRSSIEAVRDGAISGAFVVSGKPVEPLLSLTDRSKVRLLPLTGETVPEGFVPSSITHEDYPSLVPEGQRVATLGVQNVLFGYDWPARSPRGKVGNMFLSILMYRLPDLQVGQRHPKWREVNVAASLDGWKRLPAMADWLKDSRPRRTGPASEAEFESFLKRNNTRVTGENRETLYQDYLRWRNGPMAGGTP